MAIDYAKVRNHVQKNMPGILLSGDIISVKIIEGPCPEKKINFMSLRGDGQILPVDYLFYYPDGASSNKKSLKVPKGYKWLPKYLCMARDMGDPNILPAAFIHLFSRDFLDRTEYDLKPFLSLSSGDIFLLLESSRDELLSRGCCVPDHYCKSFIDSDLEELLLIADKGRSRDTTIAKMILTVFENMANRYVFVEERYSDKEYERVNSLLQSRNEYMASRLSKAWNAYKEKPQDAKELDEQS